MMGSRVRVTQAAPLARGRKTAEDRHFLILQTQKPMGSEVFRGASVTPWLHGAEILGAVRIAPEVRTHRSPPSYLSLRISPHSQEFGDKLALD